MWVSPVSFHLQRSIATCYQFLRTIFLIRSVHLSGSLSLGRILGGLQFKISLVQRSFVLLAICPTQLHFSDACCRIHQLSHSVSEHNLFHGSLCHPQLSFACFC